MDTDEQGIDLRLLPEFILGAEDEGTEGEESEESEETEGEESEETEGEEGEEHDDAKDEKTKGLRSALAKERAARKAAERAQKKLQKDADDKALAEKSELEQATTKLTKAEQVVEKLKAGYLKREVTSAIEKAATKAGFINIADAVDALKDSDEFSVEQDEDDPSEVNIDLKALEKAVKGLATKKPYLIKSGTDDGEATGSQFGNAGGGKKKDGEKSLKDLYPALR